MSRLQGLAWSRRYFDAVQEEGWQLQPYSHAAERVMDRKPTIKNMRWCAIFLIALTLGVLSCGRESNGTITHRGRGGRPDQWVSRISSDTYKIAIDTNGDGLPDVFKTYKDNELVRIESDRNFDGKVDLVREYSKGILVREIHDDDFDGKPEMIKTFRPDGTVAIVERDPRERGSIDIMEFYDDSGRLTRREVRTDKDP